MCESCKESMRTFKRTMLRVFFALEVSVFVGVYLFGPSGLQTMLRLEHENVELDQEIEKLQVEVGSWEQKIIVWKGDDFYKEKIAREQLQMARSGDEIFYLNKS